MLAPFVVAGFAVALAVAPTGGPIRLAADVEVTPIAAGVYLHVTTSGPEMGRVPANGLIVEDGAGAWLVDTGWSAAQAEALLAFCADKLHKHVRGAVVTHFHQDRVGGVALLRRRGIPVFGRRETAELVRDPASRPSETFDAPTQAVGPLELFYPGPGHTRDNLIVWHAASGTLVGGCLIKSLAATDLGYTHDAEVDRWPASVRAARARYPSMRRLVPGHGAVGGVDLFDHTLALLAAGAR